MYRIGLSLFVTALLLVFGQMSASGQCTTLALALDGGSCGVLLVTENSEVLEPVNLPMLPEPGELLFIGYELSLLPGSCSGNPLVVLNCMQLVAEGISCATDFNSTQVSGYSVQFHPGHALPWAFSYSWNFGNGEVSNEVAPIHEFPGEGSYLVCLEVTDWLGNCTVQYCQDVEVTNDLACGFAIDLQLDGLNLVAQVYNTVDFGPYHPDTAVWYLSNTGDIVGFGPELTYTFPAAQGNISLCVEYQVLLPGGLLCQHILCEPLMLSDSCVDATQINPNCDCPPLYEPVCGCDGNTYQNACEASNLFGVQSWTPGPCPNANDGPDCFAYFTIQPGANPLDVIMEAGMDYGPQVELIWYWDGYFAASGTSTLEMNMADPGVYECCLTIIDTDSGCSSTYCQESYMGDPAELCEYTDCVWPGDANADAKANVYDLLPIGLLHGHWGFFRPEAHTQWVGQHAPSWQLESPDMVDAKHLDTDGDGQIHDDDRSAILLNYQPAFELPVLEAPNGAPLYLMFDIDTLVVDDNSPDEILVTAGLYLGDADAPALNLHGMALQVYYPQQDLVLPHGTQFVPEPSFLGQPAELLPLDYPLFDLERIDVGLSKRNASGGNGFGRVATFEFIVISDIIGGRSEETIEFGVFLESPKLIDAQGLPIPIGPGSLGPHAFTIVNQRTPVSTAQAERMKAPQVFPNPASDLLTVYSQQSSIERVQLFDGRGSLVHNWFGREQTQMSLPLGGLSAGLYLVQIDTPEGRFTERLSVVR